MSSKLTSDYVMVTIFWSLVAWLVFGFSSPAENLRVAHLVAALGFSDIALPTKAGLGDAMRLQAFVFNSWTLPMLGLGVLLAGLGAVLTYFFIRDKEMARLRRTAADPGFGGIAVTLGWMPVPASLPTNQVTLSTGVEMPVSHQMLLDEVLGVLAAHPDSFVGDGHGVDLATHTLNVIEAMLAEGNRDPLALVCAAAHDLGKITSYEKTVEGEWRRIRMHDKESARLIATMPSFLLLSDLERQALGLALAFGHDTAHLPECAGSELAHRLLARAKRADSAATKQEKERVLDDLPLPEMVLRAFLEILPTIPLQSPGLPKKVAAAGWRVGNRAWFLEWRVREEAMRKLPPDVRAAMGGDWRDKHRPAPYMTELLKELGARGWLVTNYEPWTCDPENALWRIRAGIKEFNGVFAVDLPALELVKLPAETAYALEVLGPQMALQAGTPVSDFGEVGLFKDSPPAKVKPKTTPAVPVAAPQQPEVLPPAGGLIQNQVEVAVVAGPVRTSPVAAATPAIVERADVTTPGVPVPPALTPEPTPVLPPVPEPEPSPVPVAEPGPTVAAPQLVAEPTLVADPESFALTSYTSAEIKAVDARSAAAGASAASAQNQQKAKKVVAQVPSGWPAVAGKPQSKQSKPAHGKKPKQQMDPMDMGLLR